MMLNWYLSRLRAMNAGEVWGRIQDRIAQEYWRRRYFARDTAPKFRPTAASRKFLGGMDRSRAADAPPAAVAQLLNSADGLLAGQWQTFATARSDVTPDVDWHFDPKTGVSLHNDAFTFSIRAYGNEIGFDTKYVWELSRHQHTTSLAMAYWLTGKDIYARAAVAHISQWRSKNAFLHGIHWGSSIELAMRLMSLVWVRRLLADWPEVQASFEVNDEFVQLIYAHQWLLSRRLSSGSSANNHLLLEAAGLYISASAMPWFIESSDWQGRAKTILARELALQIFPSGYDRELASEYNGFVLETVLLCLAESVLAGSPLPAMVSDSAARMVRTTADLADCRGHPPRQGDGDDAHALLLDAPDYDRWLDLLEWGGAWFTRRNWWPAINGLPSLRSWLLAPLAPPDWKTATIPAERRVSELADAGLVILRAGSGTEEIYCAFDAGPLGYLAIAAHGHADALAIELRYGGHPILVDCGTYNFTSLPLWREYFRSTLAHNTVELGGISQSTAGGPFLWARHGDARLLHTEGLPDDRLVATATGEHNGYASAGFSGSHRRSVTLYRQEAQIVVRDEIAVLGSTACRVLFHLHPSVTCELENKVAHFCWKDHGQKRTLRMELPNSLVWRMARGETDPILGWYSPAFDVKTHTITLVGEVTVSGAVTFETIIQIL